jgi:hypothetical protein
MWVPSCARSKKQKRRLTEGGGVLTVGNNSQLEASLGGDRIVLVDDEISPSNPRRPPNRIDRTRALGHAKLDAAMRRRGVVVRRLGSKDPIEVTATEHEYPIQAFVPDRLDEALGKGIGSRRADRGEDDLGTFSLEHRVEGVGELGISIANEKTHGRAVIIEIEAEVARLLSHPCGIRVAGRAGDVNSAGSELDEEQHLESLQEGRLDGEEIAGEDAFGLSPQELRPARA